MDTLRAQIAAMSEEIQFLKEEVVQTKASHAGLHQDSVARSTEITRRFDALKEQIDAVGAGGVGQYNGGKFKKPLIEPKQVEVAKFAGAVSDSRCKFLEWTETVKDRAGLFDENLVEAMNKVEALKEPVTKEASLSMNISAEVSKELHGFLKDRCSGTAEAIVRGNKSGVGLESWRLLAHQFNPHTLTGP